MFDAIEEAFDDIARAVQHTTVAALRFSIRPWRDHHFLPEWRESSSSERLRSAFFDAPAECHAVAGETEIEHVLMDSTMVRAHQRSRGGLSTKLHLAVDPAGRPCD